MITDWAYIPNQNPGDAHTAGVSTFMSITGGNIYMQI